MSIRVVYVHSLGDVVATPVVVEMDRRVPSPPSDLHLNKKGELDPRSTPDES